MIDYFALALTHGLLLIAALRLLGTDALDSEPDPDPDPHPDSAPQPEPPPARGSKRRRDA